MKNPPNLVQSSRIDSDSLGSLVLGSGRAQTTYVPNGGNAGDSLIAEATYQFFDRIGLRYTTASLADRLPRQSRVIVGGGGNLVLPYPNVRDFLDRNLECFDELIILPHTVQAYEDVLARLDARCTIICRELSSFEFCRTHAPKARILCGDDMALLWNREETDTRAHAERLSNLGDLRFHLRNLKHLVRGYHRGKIRNGTLQAFRKDVESRNRQIPTGNVDLSQAFATDSMARPYSACAISALAGYIDRAEVVRTDRLHIAILSALLGKRVEMYDNSYGKNRAVYDFSLAPRFPSVTFVD